MHKYLSSPGSFPGFPPGKYKPVEKLTGIFTGNQQKKSILRLALILVLIGISITLMSCSSKPESMNYAVKPANSAEKLYQYKGSYTGDNSAVGGIIHTLAYSDLPVKSYELKTDSIPYGITVNYQVDDRAKYRLNIDNIENGWNKNAAVMFSLIPNADEIKFQLYDQYGEFAGSYYNRNDLNERFGMEYFSSDTVKNAAASLDSFTRYLNQVNSIKNQADFYSDNQKLDIERNKQIYSVIGEDREIVMNSGVNFPVHITKDFAAHPPIKELVDQKNLFVPYIGNKVEFYIYDITNYKTNQNTCYLFAFGGAKMIAYSDLKTAGNQQNVARILNALQSDPVK